jgi:hypothetical protein
MVQLSATGCSCIAILWASLVSFAAITLCVASQQVFIVVSVYFVMTPSGNFWIHPCTRSLFQRHLVAEIRGAAVSSPASYSTYSDFDSQLGGRLFWVILLWFPSVREKGKVFLMRNYVALPWRRILMSALNGGECSTSRPSRYISGISTPGAHRIRGWICPSVGLDAVAKGKQSLLLPGIEFQSSSPYPGHCTDWSTPIMVELSLWFEYHVMKSYWGGGMEV